VHTIPSDPAEARGLFPWIEFEGRWGELRPAFFNGPTGPNLKSQWTEPIRWSEDWRDRSLAVPAGGALGTGATDFFCEAVAAGSNVLRRAAENPGPVIGVLLALLAIVVFLLSRATWRPTAPLRLAHRRAWGQVLASATRMYLKRMPLFVGIGLLFLPVSVIITLLQAVFLGASSVVGIDTEAESTGILVLLVLAVSTALTLFAFELVRAATARALVEIDEGRRIGALGAYRLAFDNIGPLLRVSLIMVVLISLLVTSVFLIPIAIWIAVRWALVVPVVELENRSAIAALRRSARLVRQEWLKVASLTVVGGALALVTGPLIGALLILLTSAPLAFLNIVAGVVYALAAPFVALTTAYVYFDARVRDELAPEPELDELPAEIQLST
jgi:hypothetical protein